jgi:putative PIN family toxin of toxin-antitoxin system
MASANIVIDTNVIIAGLRSRTGTSNALLGYVFADDGAKAQLSMPLFLQYRAEIARHIDAMAYEPDEVHDILEWIAAHSTFHNVYFLWRPCLPDPDDEMVLELAVGARAPYIVTHNVRDFAGIEHFGIKALTPVQFLVQSGVPL